MARRFKKILKTKKQQRKLLHCVNLKKTNIYKKRIESAKKFVMNLSAHELSDNEILLLAKGIKFIKTPSTKNANRMLLNDFDEFARKMRCTYLFNNGMEYEKHPFYLNTGFSPNYSCAALENYLFATKLELSKIKLKKRLPNLKKDELSWFNWRVSFAPEFQCCYFCEPSCLFYLSFNFNFYVSKIMHL